MSTASLITRTRQSRSIARGDRRVIRLTERDLWLLEALDKMRFLTTRQLAQLLFGKSRSAANKRLRALLDCGYVKAWVPNLSADNIYSLTLPGLVTLGMDDRPRSNRSLPRELDSHLGHVLAINDVRLALATGLAGEGSELMRWQSDWEIRRPNRGRLLPDALFAIRWDEGIEQAFALELDHHSRNPRRFLRKVLRYIGHRPLPTGRSLPEEAITLVVGSDPPAVDRSREALVHSRLVAPIWFATLDAVRAAGAGRAIWRSAGADTEYSLRELVSLPYRKEGLNGANAVSTHACAP